MNNFTLLVVSYSVPISNHNQSNHMGESLKLYLILFLYQTTTYPLHRSTLVCCILFCSYIKPQRAGLSLYRRVSCILFCSYIKPQLKNAGAHSGRSCILFCSYIKPQLSIVLACKSESCILFCSYIKPQLIK